jgi:hypothetical protein
VSHRVTAILQSEASIVNLYLHEIFLHDGHNIKEFAAPLTEEYPVPASGIIPQPLNATHRKALAICIVSVKDVLDIFLSFDTETLCSIPTFQYVRTAYTVFAMMKIYFAASRLDSEFHEMMNTDLNVEFYLDELLKSLQEVSRTKKIRVAAIFRLVLLMLRTWFQRQKSQTGLDRGHVRRDDTILHTVLRTVDAIDADGNLHDGSSRAEDIEMAHTSFPIQTTAENVVRSSVDSWPLEPDEEMLPWSEFDFESFLEKDDSMLLQIALERFGGLIG